MKVAAITGNVTRPSKTRALADYVVSQPVFRNARSEIFDLLDISPALGATFWRNNAPPDVERVLTAIETCDVLLVGTPVYKASYTGLLKHFFDLFDMKALVSKPVVAFATGKASAHGQSVEAHMRSLFDFFEARMPGSFIYALDQDFTEGEPNADLKIRIDREMERVGTLIDA